VNRLRLGKPGRILAATLVLGATVLGAASGAGADGTGAKLTVTQLDSGLATNGGRSSLELTYLGNPTPPAVTVTENGQPVKLDGAPTQLTRDRAVAFVIDSGKGMNDGDLLPHVRDTILAQTRSFPSMEYAVVQAGDRADVRTNFTREPERLAAALNAVGPTRGSAVWDAVNQAAAMLAERTNLQPNIVLVTADDDTVAVDGTAAAAARGSVAAGTVTVVNVAYGGRGSQITDPEPYELLSQTTGSAFEPTADREALLAKLRAAVTAVGERQYRVGWTSSATAGDPLHIDVAVGDEHQEMDVIAGRGLYRGYAQLQPAVAAAATPYAIPGMDNPLVLGLALLLVLLGVAGAAYAVTTSLVRNDLSNVLEPYADAYKLMDGDTEEQGSSMVAKSAFLQRAVALTEQVAENQGLLTRAEGALERANLPLRAGEAMFGYVVLVVALTVIPLVLTKSLVPALVFGALGAVIPLMAVSQIAKSRRKKFLSQLPDTLSLLSGTLKAGYSLMQGVEAVSQEVSEPMGLELRRVITESRLGRPLEESLEASADRMDSPDFEWAVMAIRIQREVGGNLAELLMTVGDTMVARERLRRDVAALTAEGRVSAYMLAAMPPILAAVMYVLNKEYVSILFTDVVGMFMVGLATLSMIIGFFWMKKIITIEI
jgi:tight adherence protein B